MAGHPLSDGPHYHRGHASPHTLGGPTDIKLVPQLGSVNVEPFRDLERRAVATLAIGYTRPEAGSGRSTSSKGSWFQDKNQRSEPIPIKSRSCRLLGRADVHAVVGFELLRCGELVELLIAGVQGVDGVLLELFHVQPPERRGIAAFVL